MSAAFSPTMIDGALMSLLDGRVGAVVLGCAGMEELSHRLSDEFGVPAIDPVRAAVKQCEALVGLGLRATKRGAYDRAAPERYKGVLTSFAPPISIP